MPEEKPLLSQALPDYENPPLNEISAGVQFEPLTQWQSRHVGQFWSEIRKEFPTTEDQLPIFEMEQPQILRLPPLRRTFLVSEDQNFVVQLQETRFIFNWRKRRDGDVYPRFEAFFGKFLHYWGLFSEFVQRERVGNLKPTKYELSYINHIEQFEAPLAITAERYVKMLGWSDLKSQFLTPPTGLSVVWTFALPEQMGFGQANLGQGVRLDGRAVLLFSMSCSGAASPKISINEWFLAAHVWLAKGFAELTTDTARKDWGYKG
jgi:uncharacterized protein (TIGR04255 family)